MSVSSMDRVMQRIRQVVVDAGDPCESDADLLARFLSHSDSRAVSVLIRRHAPMVWGVCRRILFDHHDAEDAFQATFLVLLRKANTIKPRSMVGNWLHGVALQTALKARAMTIKRSTREKPMATVPDPVPKATGDHPMLAFLDEELNRLPVKYRVALVICDLEGKTRAEAARELGWAEGTVASCLARGRQMLAKRLARHGTVVSAGAISALLANNVASAAPASVVASTVQAAITIVSAKTMAAAGLSQHVITLADGVMKTMLLSKLKLVGVALTILMLAVTTGYVAGLYGQDNPGSTAKTSDTERIDQLIRQLGSSKFADRAAANKALAEIGEPALPALRRTAVAGIDLETRRRVEDLVRKIERRWELLCFKGHTDAVPGAVLSTDGQFVLSAGRSESNPRLWDANTAKELRNFQGHTSWVWSVAFTPDGKRAVSAGVDGMRLWEVETGKELRRFGFPLVDKGGKEPDGGHTRQIYRVVISGDGRRALSGSQDKTVRLWDVETGKALGCFSHHEDEILSVALSPDGRRAVSTSADNKMLLWDVDKGNVLYQLPGASCAVFSPDGRHVLSGGRDEFMRLWDVKTGKELRRFQGHSAGVDCVAFSRDGKQVLSGSADNTVRLWDVPKAKELRCFRGHTDSISSVGFCADGKRALSASYDMTMRLWQLPR